MTRLWSDLVHQLTPYVPGEQPKRTDLVKLNTNENPYPPSPAVLDAVRAELGVDPAVIPSWKALVGDSSDGYSGVKGFGPVAWDRLLADYGEAGLQWLQAIIEADLPADLRPYADSDERMGKLYHQWSEVQRGWRLASLNPAAMPIGWSPRCRSGGRKRSRRWWPS